MTGEKLSNQSYNQDADKWANMEVSSTPSPESIIKQFATNVCDIQKDFAGALARAKEKGKNTLDKKDFELWEGDYRDAWNAMEERERSAGLYSPAQIAAVEEPVIAYLVDSELHKTIEAQAGHYYDERSDALLAAIRKSDEPDKKADLEYARDFRRAVLRHLDYKYIEAGGDWRKDDADYYNRSRTRAHNSVIDHLNGLNALAEKYKTTRFTPRNFWTSDIKEQTPAMSRRMRYDRDIVEEYYAIAFSYEINDYEKELEKNRKFY